jgi:hypothetical protein
MTYRFTLDYFIEVLKLRTEDRSGMCHGYLERSFARRLVAISYFQRDQELASLFSRINNNSSAFIHSKP